MGEHCTNADHFRSVVYEHQVVAQAAAHIDPQGNVFSSLVDLFLIHTAVVPPWFQGAIREVRNDIMAEIRGIMLPPLFRVRLYFLTVEKLLV